MKKIKNMELTEIEKKMKTLYSGKVETVNYCNQCAIAQTRLRSKRAAYYCSEKGKDVKPSQIACEKFKKL